MELNTLLVAVGPTDESRVTELTDSVLAVAGPADAEVVLFHSFTDAALEEGVRETGHDPEDPPEPREVAALLESVDAMTTSLSEAGLDFEVRSAINAPMDAILQATDAVDADMVFVGGRGRSPVGKAILGSTAQRIMTNAPCPVVFVREGIGK
jgi:nucleotide-binding universal stress UspA family protein